MSSVFPNEEVKSFQNKMWGMWYKTTKKHSVRYKKHFWDGTRYSVTRLTFCTNSHSRTLTHFFSCNILDLIVCRSPWQQLGITERLTSLKTSSLFSCEWKSICKKFPSISFWAGPSCSFCSDSRHCLLDWYHRNFFAGNFYSPCLFFWSYCLCIFNLLPGQ